MSKQAHLNLTDSTVDRCRARRGGAFGTRDNSAATIGISAVSFLHNAARYGGVGFFGSGAHLLRCDLGQTAGNTAVYSLGMRKQLEQFKQGFEGGSGAVFYFDGDVPPWLESKIAPWAVSAYNTAGDNQILSSSVKSIFGHSWWRTPSGDPMATYGQPITVWFKDAFNRTITDSELASGICSLEFGTATSLGETSSAIQQGMATWPTFGVIGQSNQSFHGECSCVMTHELSNGDLTTFTLRMPMHIVVEDCPVGYASVFELGSSVVKQCTFCEAGTYLLGVGEKCRECVRGGECIGGSEILPIRGFYRNHSKPFKEQDQIYPCPFADQACPGGKGSICAAGYQGIVCGVCAENHYLTNKGCLPCGDFSVADAIFLAIVVILLTGLILTWLAPTCASKLDTADAQTVCVTKGPQLDQTNAEKQAQLDCFVDVLNDKIDVGVDMCSVNLTNELDNLAASAQASSIPQTVLSKAKAISDSTKGVREFISAQLGQFKILYTTLQIVATFLANYEVPWPDFFVSWVESIQMVNIGIFDVTSVQCYFTGVTFYDNLNTQMALPLVVSATIFLCAKIRMHLKEIMPNSSVEARERKRVESQHMFAFLFLLFIVYAGASTTIMRTFKCTKVYDKWLLDADWRLECYNAEWTNYALLAAVGIVLYPVGIPCFCFVSLLRHKRDLHCDLGPLRQEAEKARGLLTKYEKTISQVRGPVPQVMFEECAELQVIANSKQVALEQVVQA